MSHCHQFCSSVLLVAAAAMMQNGCDKQAPPTSVRQPTSGPSKSLASAPTSDDGSGPGGRVDAAPWFTEEAAKRGIRFQHDSGHRGRKYLFPECVCGGAALFDMDNDGDLDAYLVQAHNLADPDEPRPGNQLFRNRGDGVFDDATEGSGADLRAYGMGVAAGDFDNDGFVDLYVTNLGPNVLLRNLQGTGRFSDVTSAAGVGHDGFASSAAFLDYDADGDLDLYVANYVYWSVSSEQTCYSQSGEPDYCSPKAYSAPARDVLYRNNGDGSFGDVSKEAGLHEAFGNGLGVVCGDFSGDGQVDIFVANDGSPNQLWTNLGNGKFEDRAHRAGCAVDADGCPKAGMGVFAVDFDEDADLDVLVVNLDRETDSLYCNQGGSFTEIARTVGLSAVTRSFTRFGTAMHDFNNDGWRDLFTTNGRVRRQSRQYGDDPYAEPDSLLRGTSARRLEEVLPRGGTSPSLIASGRAAAFGDIDNDGALDILIVNRDGPAHLLHNQAPGPDAGGGNWIMFRVVEEHGRDAYGATVTIKLGDRTLRSDVRSAYSYCAANDPRVHFGLGDATKVESAIVRWVEGTVEEFGDQAAGQIITLKRGTGGAHRTDGS